MPNENKSLTFVRFLLFNVVNIKSADVINYSKQIIQLFLPFRNVNT